MSDSKSKSAYGVAASDTDFRKNWDLDEYAAKAKEREAKEREEAKARYEAKLAGKKYHKPMTGNETYTSARRNIIDVSAQVGKTQLVPAGAGVGKRGRGAGFYCEACDLTFKDNLQWVEHLLNTGQTTEVKRATLEEVHERIEFYIRRKEDLEKEKATSLQDRLQLREEEMQKEAEEKRKKRKEEAEKKRQEKEQAAKVKTEYGDDVRIEGEHDEDDMMAQMGFTGFGTSKK
ncbi:zinc finger, double-stranded rna binding [Trichoderma arundinaceum]|uniref:Zinc finger, double-stranded rna binding n=1 Tax=Trichoderma arundinaceum TaxID=490622 RepID=A0A395N8G5_TRIAR|nr:zinc finger, double-stranded rna binding [Trichoderma arundinaceum]